MRQEDIREISNFLRNFVELFKEKIIYDGLPDITTEENERYFMRGNRHIKRELSSGCGTLITHT